MTLINYSQESYSAHYQATPSSSNAYISGYQGSQSHAGGYPGSQSHAGGYPGSQNNGYPASQGGNGYSGINYIYFPIQLFK